MMREHRIVRNLQIYKCVIISKESSRHAPFAERAAQEFKNMVNARLKIDKGKWVELIQPMLNKYNSRQHGTTGLWPNDARDPKTKYKYIIILPQKQFITENTPPYLWIVQAKPLLKKEHVQKGMNQNGHQLYIKQYRLVIIRNNIQ